MANEISVTAALNYTNTANGIASTLLQIGGSTNNAAFSITGKNFTYLSKSFPTSAGGTAIPLGAVGTLGWCAIKNNDATNYIQVLTAASGTTFLRINAGEMALFRFDQGITAPAILANTASVLTEVLLLEN